MNIKVRIDELLAEREMSFYRLSKETGISHTTLWRLKKDKALGINFVTLEKLCQTLNCNPGDILTLENKEAKVSSQSK
jgi:putative transcriptional regulator